MRLKFAVKHKQLIISFLKTQISKTPALVYFQKKKIIIFKSRACTALAMILMFLYKIQ